MSEIEKGPVRDYFGYLRWTATSCRRCGYEQADCTCPVGFAAPAYPADADANAHVVTWLVAMAEERGPVFLAACAERKKRNDAAEVERIRKWGKA